MTDQLPQVLKELEAGEEKAVERLFELIRIPQHLHRSGL